jgi:hypothetical protein
MARVQMDPDWKLKLEPYVEKFMSKLARDVLMDMHEHCPVHTGYLQSDLAAEVSGYSARIGARSAEYAIYVEEGAGPHMIYPNSKGALWWEGLAHPVNMVNHPGSPATHFMRNALYKQRGDI